MKQEKTGKIPEFKSLEEEREYWESRGPLAEGQKGRLVKPKAGQQRSSILAVRLTGEELSRLRDIAAKRGVGPSTFARLVLSSVIEHEGELPKVITLDQLKSAFASNIPQAVRDKSDIFTRKVAIGDPDNPSLLIIDGSQLKETEELALDLFSALLAMIGVQVITPSDKRYKQMKRLVEA